MLSSMKRVFLPRHFLASGLLLLILASLYVFFEAQRLQQELLRQTEDKGTALAKAMETSVKNAIVGNALLEDLIRQRLVDNAQLIDQLLLSRHVDQAMLKEISAMNRLQKIDLLDEQGRPWKLAALPTVIARKKSARRNLSAAPPDDKLRVGKALAAAHGKSRGKDGRTAARHQG